MFAGSENGARNSAICFSLIVSCKLAGADPFAYLRDMLTRLQSRPADRIGELVPCEWKKRFGPQASPATPAAACNIASPTPRFCRPNPPGLAEGSQSNRHRSSRET